MLKTLYKEDREIKCNPDQAHVNQLVKFGWSTEKPNQPKPILKLKKAKKNG